jgi:phosphate/sulfate permease
MEVARKGVFDPDRFYSDGTLMVTAIIALYLGVMAADVLLLDLFNTFGLPTSTTVSIVSELVGASIAVALWTTPGGFWTALSVIQTGPVLGIYTGIFLSVLIAFSVSALIMIIVRVIYGRDLGRTFPAMGWFWTGLSFVAMAYFVLFKGLKNANVLNPDQLAYVKSNILWVMLVTFALAALVGFIFRNHYKSVLRILILMGTFALGLAFAGNDLVNFIGPSVAAGQAVFVEGIKLSGKVPTPWWALIIAGNIMVISLWTSKKARRVTDTEVRLAAHGGRSQRFKKNRFATALVSWNIAIFNIFKIIVPGPIRRWIAGRTHPEPPSADAPPYDMLRATVNLTVASLLISIGTAQKLPLSTTYITFMSAMGAALGDRTWIRQDAEQRVTGILAVLGGWVFTGFLASMGAFVMASIIVLGGAAGVFIALGLVAVGLFFLRRAKGSEDSLGSE